MKRAFLMSEEDRDKTIEEQDRIAEDILRLANLIYSDKGKSLTSGQKALLKSQLHGLMNYYNVLDSRLLFL